MRATLSVHPAGYAFANPEEGDFVVFVPPGHLGGALDGDTVLVSWRTAARGREGYVRSVLVRARTRVTGVLVRRGHDWFIEPDDPRMTRYEVRVLGRVPKSYGGNLVVATIVDYPLPGNDAMTVEVDRLLGRPGSIEAEEAKILVEHGVDDEFPPEVLAEAEHVPEQLRPSDRVGRADLTDLPFMTIDPLDARDFDDAVCVELLGKDPKRARMRIHVAVADVSHYVRPGTAIDAEARRRSFSTYLPDRAVPMLPEVLSSGICSLVPRRDRCAMVVSMEVDARGRVRQSQVRAAVIHSRKRLTYDQVAAELSGSRKLAKPVRERLFLLRAAADRLRRVRLARGAIELNLPEARILLDEDDPHRIRRIYSARASRELARAYNLIEEFMLAANEAVGRLAAEHDLPVIYRVHDKPDEERLARFAAAAEFLGVSCDPERLTTPKGIRRFLDAIADHDKREVLHGLLLRAMAQAEYDVVNIGHFALAAPTYVHFTSPIRRYPDLVTHRVVKRYLADRGRPAGPGPHDAFPHRKEAARWASHASTRERESAGAEQDTKALFAAAYMRDRIGDRIAGTITGIVDTGIFVRLDDPFVDGMIRRQQLEAATRETWEADELGIFLTGLRSHQILGLGDRLRVEVADASIARRQIDLAFVEKIDG